MGRKRTPGLFKSKNVWRIDKQIFGVRIQESTRSADLEEAERYLAKRIEEVRQAKVYGVRPKWTFRQAAYKYVLENQHKSSICGDVTRIEQLDVYLGNVPLDSIHMGVLKPYIEARKQDGVKMRTINHGLKVVRRILNLAASEWFDDQGLAWLAATPRIKMLPEPDLRKPYPLTWEEQGKLFAALPEHLRDMALFAVNTGCRDREVCRLQWDWEIPVEALNTAVFLIPAEYVKNREERLVVVNDTACEVIERRRGIHPAYVFTYRDKPIVRMLNSAWKRAREHVGLNHVRVHDLKHTFGVRLSAAGISFENRQVLLGHKINKITEHYSPADVKNLLAAANAVCSQQENAPTIIRRRQLSSCEIPNPRVNEKVVSWLKSA